MQCPSCLTENNPNSLNCTVCGSPLIVEQSSYHLSVGTILTNHNKQYRIEKTLGAGGFGITYQGVDLSNSQPVAIKENWPENGSRNGHTVIWPSYIPPKDKQQQILGVLQEAQYVHQCNHSHIVQVYDWFQANNTAYIVMEFLAGKSLLDLLQVHGKLPEKQVKKYLLQIAEALKVIHSKNLLHRDIKPENIIVVEPADRAVLIDFGNAREFIANKTQKMTQILTAGYAPIEQYGKTGRRGPSIDIYALCASMYELLTGQLPPSAPDRLHTDPLIPPRQFVSSLDPITEKVILTGMKIRVEERFATVDDLINALQGNFVSPSLQQARVKVANQQLAEAARIYQQCSEEPIAMVELAMVLMHLGDRSTETIANQAIKLNPKDGRGYGVLGLVYCRQGKWQQALQSLQQAVSLSPNQAWIQANLAWALGKLGKWQLAETAASKALELDSECTFAIGLQAWIAVNLQEWKSAIRYGRQAIFRSKQLSQPQQEFIAWVYPCLTMALEKAVVTKQATDVDRCVQEFITKVPDSNFARGFQAWRQAIQGNWSQAASSLVSINNSQGKIPPWLLLNQAIIEENLDHIPAAIAIYEAYIKQFSPDAFVLFRLGTLLGQQQQWFKAKSYLEKAIDLEPEYAQAYHNLGWVWLNIRNADGELENTRELLSTYRQAFKLYKEQNQTQLANLIHSEVMLVVGL